MSSGGQHVGRRIATYWDDEGKWFEGTIVSFDESSAWEYLVRFDDGDQESVSFRVDELVRQGKVVSEPGADGIHGVRKFRWLEDEERKGQTSKGSKKQEAKRTGGEEASRSEPSTSFRGGEEDRNARARKRRKVKQEEHETAINNEMQQSENKARREESGPIGLLEAVAAHLELDGPAPWLVLVELPERVPRVGGKEVDLKELYNQVCLRGGSKAVTRRRKWREVGGCFADPSKFTNLSTLMRKVYQTWLGDYEALRGKDTTSTPALHDENGYAEQEKNREQIAGKEQSPEKSTSPQLVEGDKKVTRRKKRGVKASADGKKESVPLIDGNTGIVSETATSDRPSPRTSPIRKRGKRGKTARSESQIQVPDQGEFGTAGEGNLKVQPRMDHPMSSAVKRDEEKHEHDAQLRKEEETQQEDISLTKDIDKASIKPEAVNASTRNNRASILTVDSKSKRSLLTQSTPVQVAATKSSDLSHIPPSGKKAKTPAFSLGKLLQNLEGGVTDKDQKTARIESTMAEKQKVSATREFLDKLASLSGRHGPLLLETAGYMLDKAAKGMAGRLVESFTQTMEEERDCHRKVTLLHFMDIILKEASHQEPEAFRHAGGLLSEAFSKNLARIVDAAAPPGREARENRGTLHRLLSEWKEQNLLQQVSIEKGLSAVFDLIKADKNALSFNPNREQRSLDFHKGLLNPTAGNVEGADVDLLEGIDGYGSVCSMEGLKGMRLKTDGIDFSGVTLEDPIRADAQVTFPVEHGHTKLAGTSSSQVDKAPGPVLDGRMKKTKAMDANCPSPGLVRGLKSKVPSSSSHRNSQHESTSSREQEKQKNPADWRLAHTPSRPGKGTDTQMPRLEDRTRDSTAFPPYDPHKQPPKSTPDRYYAHRDARSAGPSVRPLSPPGQMDPDNYVHTGRSHAPVVHRSRQGLPRLYSIEDIDEERRRRYFLDGGDHPMQQQSSGRRERQMEDARHGRWYRHPAGVAAGVRASSQGNRNHYNW